MKRRLGVHLLPELANPHELAGNLFVVIDVLRASTTIAHAIAAGIESIVPCLEVSEARNLAHRHAGDQPVLLGGERQGKPIPDFDLGNSPAEYRPESIAGKCLFFTTTNGTKAMMRCIGADRILIGSFVNLTAISRTIQTASDVELICAGTDGEITREDVLFAGALVARQRTIDPDLVVNDSAQLAFDAWQAIGGDCISHAELTHQLATTQGGRNLTAINMSADIQLAAVVDAVDVVPELFMSDWKILAADE